MPDPINLAGLVTGRIVHVRLSGQCRPAIICRVWNDQTGCSNLTVFPDWSNDGPEYQSGISWRTSVLHEEWAGGREYGWHWPQDCGETPGSFGLAQKAAQ